MDDLSMIALLEPHERREPPAVKRIPIRVKAPLGAGQLVESITTTAFGTFVVFYYTAVLGLSGSLVGIAAGASLVLDSLVDPILGSWSDNTRSRWGRRTPFMLVATPLSAAALAMVFAPPSGMGGLPLFFWLLSAALALRIGISAFHVPFTALGAELSDDYAERSSIVAWRTVFSVLGPLVLLNLAYNLFLSGPMGLRRADGYAPLGRAAAAIMIVGGLISVLGVLRTAQGLAAPPKPQRGLATRFQAEIAEIFRNPSFRVLFACAMLFYTAQGIASALGLHMNNFVWRLHPQQILSVSMSLLAGLMVGVPLAPILAARMEKRDVVIIGLVILCIAQGGLSGLRALGLFTATGAAVVGPLCLNSFCAGVGVTLAGISVASMMADAADEHDFLFDARREGLYFAGLGFAGKAATGLGSVIGGMALDMIHFPTKAPPGTEISGGTLSTLAMTAGPMVAGISLVGTAILFLYRIDRRRHADIQAELRRRREERAVS